MSIKITYFVHGTTTDNEKKISTGWSPGELSELGIQQAKNLGKLVANKHFDVDPGAAEPDDIWDFVDKHKDKYEEIYPLKRLGKNNN